VTGSEEGNKRRNVYNKVCAGTRGEGKCLPQGKTVTWERSDKRVCK